MFNLIKVIMKKIILLLSLVFSGSIICNGINTKKIINCAINKDANGLMLILDKYKGIPISEHFNIEQLIILTGDIEAIKHLIDNNNFNVHNPDNMVLHLACSTGSLELVKYFIEEHGLDVNSVNEHNMNILTFACEGGSLELVKYLIEVHKLDIDAKIVNGMTLLHAACMSGSLEVVRYLIEVYKLDVIAKIMVCSDF